MEMNDKKPTILVVNDDGIFAPGLRKLISLARKFGDVVVVAPDTAMSGMSHAITVKNPLRLRKIDEDEGYVEYSCNGTPVDAVKLGEKVVV
ncbi:MAG: 5'/3'-nucleotidase SurE, partial [Bacteroidales bacterium]|nr:5'/3'-nucleotidase SurE [Bacteroidales bacterium]